MRMKFESLLHTDFTVTDLTGVYISADTPTVYDYSRLGRHKNMIYYCEKGTFYYYNAGGAPLFAAGAGDLLFAADKANYISRLTKADLPGAGFVIGFMLHDETGAPIEITEPFRPLPKDRNGVFYGKVKQLYFNILQNQPTLSIKAAFYDLLNALLTAQDRTEDMGFRELTPAVTFMETHPEKNISIKELALMCRMSESSFAHKFSKYSNGISPLQFRNRIRVMKAEEMANDANLSVESIAKSLGFYDASYLCRFYKQHTGKTLKRSLSFPIKIKEKQL